MTEEGIANACENWLNGILAITRCPDTEAYAKEKLEVLKDYRSRLPEPVLATEGENDG